MLLLFFTNNGTYYFIFQFVTLYYFIWLVESKNKYFIRKFILYKGIRLFSREEYCPEKNKSHRC